MTIKEAKEVLVSAGIPAEEGTTVKYGKEKECLLVGEERIKPSIYSEALERIDTPQELIMYAQDVLDNIPDINVNQIISPDFIKENVVSCVRHMTEDESILKFSVYEDLEEYFRVNLGESSEGSMSVIVTKNMIETVGLDGDELRSIARENLKKQVRIDSMVQVMAEMMNLSEDDLLDMMPSDNLMYVGTNSSKSHGAAIMLLTDVLDDFCKEQGISELCIIPSSVNEVILIPSAMEEEMINDMISEVNSTQVTECERLSSHCYFHSVA